MKSKLRKEFEAFRETVSLELFLLKNPPKFKFGDNVEIDFSRGIEKLSPSRKILGIYRGVKKIECTGFCFIDGKKTFSYQRVCYVEIGSGIQEWYESDILKKDESSL